MENSKSLNRSKGNLSELHAINYLEEQNYQIIDRNWHFSNRGELDIIAIDPKRYGEEYLIFIEVRSRDESMEASLEAMNWKKQAQIKWLAKAYMQEKGLNLEEWNISFDFIGVCGSEVQHVKDI